MRIILLIIMLVVAGETKAQAGFSLHESLYFDNKVKVLVPTNFFSARQELAEERFPDEANRPRIILTDPDEEVFLAMNYAKNEGDRKTIIHLYRAIKNSIRESNQEHRFLKTDVIRNRTLAIIEYITPNVDGVNIYNMMAFKYIGDEFFFLNFSTTEEYIQKWQNTAREIAENVKENK